MQMSMFWSEDEIYTILPFKMIFFPLLRHLIFQFLSCPLFYLTSILFCIYFILLLPIFSFSFPSLLFLSPFSPFLLHFPRFSLPFFIFFPQMTSADIPPSGGRGYFPAEILRTWLKIFQFNSVQQIWLQSCNKGLRSHFLVSSCRSDSPRNLFFC